MVANRLLTTGALAGVAVVAGVLLPSAASASTYSVTSTADAGPGTLRQAILDANGDPGADTVRFNLPGPGVQTIAITSAQLPAVSETLVINGRSQPGFAGTPLVRVDNASGKQLTGLSISAAQSEVLGLELTRFAVAVRVAGDANRVQGNLIGTNAAGDAGLGNATGVKVESGAENRIGGIASSAPNVVSGNTNVGIEIVGAATTDTLVARNRIGTNPAGTDARANGVGVRIGGGSTGNMIGGDTSAQRNVISGNSAVGVQIVGAGTTDNAVAGNHIGTGPAGTSQLANGTGVRIANGANENTVGGATAGARNVISGNTGNGVELMNAGSTGNTVEGNYIGVDATGGAELGNDSGVFVGVGPNTIGTPGAGNVISGNDLGIEISSSSGNVVAANYIGTDATGTAAIGGPSAGVEITGFGSNTIGGTTEGARNVISGNGGGVFLNATNFNTISGNYIGTDATGSAPLGNSSSGVSIFRGDGNTIGGTTAGARNVISANGVGVRMNSGSNNTVFGNRVAGNYIGTDAAGNAALGNDAGVIIVAHEFGTAAANRIGGSTAGARNVISGNTGYGVVFDGADINGGAFFDNHVSGNYIGTNAGGGAALPNGGGVHFLEGVEMNGNTIGGTVAGERNVISGNAGWGVVLSGNTTHGNDAFGNTVAGNYIGTKSGGGHALGNDEGGVRLETGAQEAIVEANRIAFNAGPGVAVDGTPDPNSAVASANRILGNSIFTNGGLGIELLNGGNHDQAAPTITSVVTNGGTTMIEGTLASTPSTTFGIELFSSPRCDPSGAGEGKTLIGSTDATTDGAGNASFSTTVAAVPAAQAITATATNSATHDTSKFSSCFKSP